MDHSCQVAPFTKHRGGQSEPDRRPEGLKSYLRRTARNHCYISKGQNALCRSKHFTKTNINRVVKRTVETEFWKQNFQPKWFEKKIWNVRFGVSATLDGGKMEMCCIARLTGVSLSECTFINLPLEAILTRPAPGRCRTAFELAAALAEQTKNHNYAFETNCWQRRTVIDLALRARARMLMLLFSADATSICFCGGWREKLQERSRLDYTFVIILLKIYISAQIFNPKFRFN
jgi:hypothetical protein